MSHKILVSTLPFGLVDPRPLELLRAAEGVELAFNPFGRRLISPELKELIPDVSILIAGTEPITRESLDVAKKLQIICRVGIGLDSIDLETIRKRGIKVTYTPDAPAPAVAELTIAHMLNLSRSLGEADREMRNGTWNRRFGTLIRNSVIGIIGVGRIGKRVIHALSGFHPKTILVNDMIDIEDFAETHGCVSATKREIFEHADIVSLHVPLTPTTRDLVTLRELAMMKTTAVVINTARGGIINETDLYAALKSGGIAGAAIDVFEQEPYSGPLLELDNCVLSCHLGSCTSDSRLAMELGAVEDALHFIRGEPLTNEVPKNPFDTAKP